MYPLGSSKISSLRNIANSLPGICSRGTDSQLRFQLNFLHSLQNSRICTLPTWLGGFYAIHWTPVGAVSAKYHVFTACKVTKINQGNVTFTNLIGDNFRIPIPKKRPVSTSNVLFVYNVLLTVFTGQIPANSHGLRHHVTIVHLQTGEVITGKIWKRL